MPKNEQTFWTLLFLIETKIFSIIISYIFEKYLVISTTLIRRSLHSRCGSIPDRYFTYLNKLTPCEYFPLLLYYDKF